MTRLILDAEPFKHNEIITFSDLREDVRREVLCPPHVSGPQYKSLPTFQTTMKGFRKGELSVYTGPTGSGKTTLLSQLSLDLCEQGINTLWYICFLDLHPWLLTLSHTHTHAQGLVRDQERTHFEKNALSTCTYRSFRGSGECSTSK